PRAIRKYMRSSAYVFFFQAEDGIRDGHVTGVQTCALPISPKGGSYRGAFDFSVDPNNPFDSGDSFANALLGNFRSYSEAQKRLRSEERRVGKEGRCRWWRYH